MCASAGAMPWSAIEDLTGLARKLDCCLEKVREGA